MKKKTIELPCFGIVINLIDPDKKGRWQGASISSELHEGEGQDRESYSDDQDRDSYEVDKGAEAYDNMMDAVESLVMAHAAAGVNVESPVYIEGLETAVQAMANAV
jgi:hypothetical protein